MAMRKFCDYCNKEISGASLDDKWLEVMIGKSLKVSVTIYDQTVGDTDLCDICYCDAVGGALDQLRAIRDASEELNHCHE